jgi:UDP-N-acetylmuramyl tripeptide synthase
MILSKLQVPSKIKHGWKFHQLDVFSPWTHLHLVCHDDTKRYLKGKGVICWCPHICPNAWLCPRFEKIDKMSLIFLVAQLFTATYSCLFWFVKLIYQGFQPVRINHWFPGPCRSGCSHGQTPQRHLRAFGPDMSSSSGRILQCKEMTIQPESDLQL